MGGCGGSVSTTTDDGGVTTDGATSGDGTSADGASTDDILEAAQNCPVTAIFVAGEEGELYP